MNTIKLFYKLGDGIAFHLKGKVVTFQDRESALEFKRMYPAWHCQYQVQKKDTRQADSYSVYKYHCVSGQDVRNLH